MSQAEEPLYLEELDSLEADDVMRLYHGVSEDPSMMAQYLKPVIESWYNNDRANFDTSLQNLRTYESVTALGQGDADVASMTSLVAHYVTTGSGNSRKSTGSSNIPSPAEVVLSLFQNLRFTPPRLIQSPPTQPRRASVAMIVRMKPSPELAFEGHVPEGFTGDVIPEDDWGVGYGYEDFLRLPWVNHPGTVPEILFIRRSQVGPLNTSSTSAKYQRWSSHIAFPGGRHESADESALYTALRETWEEVGVDLADKEFVQVGRLDEREITTSLGKRLLMILSPFVFLQTTPFTPAPELQASEVSSVHWIPLSLLTPPYAPSTWSHIEIDISTRMSPRNQLVRWALRGLVGKMQFGCVLLPDEPEVVAEGFNPEDSFVEPAEGGGGSWYDREQGKRLLRLWGLSLGMTLDLLAHLPTDTHIPPPISISRPASPTRQTGPKTPVTVTSSFDDQWEAARKAMEASKLQSQPASPVEKDPSTAGTAGAGLTRVGTLGKKVDVKGLKGRRRRGVGPGVTAVFPRFTYPDVNFWIWVFGRKYRSVVRGWEASMRGPDRASDRRMNWSGAALSTFYSAVRHALVVAIIIRALATGVGIAGIAWWLFGSLGGARGSQEL